MLFRKVSECGRNATAPEEEHLSQPSVGMRLLNILTSVGMRLLNILTCRRQGGLKCHMTLWYKCWAAHLQSYWLYRYISSWNRAMQTLIKIHTNTTILLERHACCSTVTFITFTHSMGGALICLQVPDMYICTQ